MDHRTDHRTRGSSDKLVVVNGHDDFSGDRRSLQYDALKSGQVFKIIVTDQAMPVAYSVDFGQLGSDSLVPWRPLPMVDKTAVSTNRTNQDDVSSARIEIRAHHSRE